MPTSVLLVGCCEVDRLGFFRLKNTSKDDFDFQAHDPDSALQQFAVSGHDIVMIDANHPGSGPLPLIHAIRKLVDKQPILLFARQENPAILCQAAEMGVLGVILYSDPISKIQERLHLAASGRAVWSPEDLRRLAAASTTISRRDGHQVPLTHREKDILKQLVKGGTNKDIAHGLGISYETVKEHIQNILGKVGVNDRSQAAIWAMHHHVV